MAASNAVRRQHSTLSAPVVTLRLLAMAEDARSTLIDEPEQLVLPFDWVRALPPVRLEAPPPPAERADPKQWGARIALASFEIMMGRRPASQLARHVDARTLHQLAVLTSRYANHRQRRRPNAPVLRPRITSVRCFQPHPDAAELTVVMHDGERFRALAMRMNAKGTQWLTTAFEVG